MYNDLVIRITTAGSQEDIDLVTQGLTNLADVSKHSYILSIRADNDSNRSRLEGWITDTHEISTFIRSKCKQSWSNTTKVWVIENTQSGGIENERPTS